jgi:hypothetical protein
LKKLSSKKKKFAMIGLKVTIDHYLSRFVDDYKETKEGYCRVPNPKVSWTKNFIRKSKVGVIVGFGICWNGKIVTQGYDECNAFKRSTPVYYVKVVFDPDAQPYKVLFSGVHIHV